VQSASASEAPRKFKIIDFRRLSNLCRKANSNFSVYVGFSLEQIVSVTPFNPPFAPPAPAAKPQNRVEREKNQIKAICRATKTTQSG
jgi:hypothetical protein